MNFSSGMNQTYFRRCVPGANYTARALAKRCKDAGRARARVGCVAG